MIAFMPSDLRESLLPINDIGVSPINSLKVS